MAPFEKEENRRIDMCSSNPDLERICTLGGGVDSCYNCNSATLLQNKILDEVLTHKLSFTKNHTPLQWRGKNFLATTELRNSGEGLTRRAKTISTFKQFFSSPSLVFELGESFVIEMHIPAQGFRKEQLEIISHNKTQAVTVSVSEQNLLFPYYPISLFPFKKGGALC